MDSIISPANTVSLKNEYSELKKVLLKLNDRRNFLEKSNKIVLAKNGLHGEYSADNLRFIQMRNSFDQKLLERFYTELMIPSFPADEERDALEDWINIMSPEGEHKTNKDYKGPWMNVILLVGYVEETMNNSLNHHNSMKQTSIKNQKILGGIVYEYYRYANCGLVSYLVVAKESRRKGVIEKLHELALVDLKLLSIEETLKRECSESNFKTDIGPLAVFLETRVRSYQLEQG